MGSRHQVPTESITVPSRRDARVDLVKVLASFGVVVVHTSMFALGEQARLGSADWWLANLANSMGRNTSHLFVMAAGAILLARPIENAPIDFVLKRLFRILPALAFWSTFYFGWRYWRGEILTPERIWRDVMTGQPYYHLWFLYAFAGLYLLFPANRMLVRPLAPRSVALLTLVCGLGYVWIFTTLMVLDGHLPSSVFILTPLFLPYLIGGFLVYHSIGQAKTRWLLAAAIASVIGIVALMGWMYPTKTAIDGAAMQVVRVPLTFVWTFSLFALILRAPINAPARRLLNVVAPVTLGIYAIHPFWIDVVIRWGLDLAAPGWNWLVSVPVVYGLSAASALLLSRLPLLRRIAY